MPSDRPIFESSIPEHLLAKASPESKYIMESLSKLTQATNYLMENDLKQNEKLESIETQTKLTNGTVKRHTEEIRLAQDTMKTSTMVAKDLEQIIFVKKMFTKKWVIGATVIAFLYFTMVIQPWLWTKEFSELLPLVKKAFGL